MPAIKAAPPALSPDRQHLADAIARRGQAEAAIARARKAAELTTEARYAAQHAIDAAEQQQRAGAASEPRLRLARVLGEPVAEPTPAQLQQALDAARAAYAEAVADDVAVNAEIAQLERSAEMLGLSRDAALAAVLRPAGEALLAEYHEAGRRVATLRLALAALGSRHGALPNFWHATQDYQPDPAPAEAVRAWIAALEADPTAALDANPPLPPQAA